MALDRKNVTISNNILTVQIDTLGAGLTSVSEKQREEGEDAVEYLWQGDPAYWADQAPNIFPYVGRLTDGSYRYAGKVYKMDIHGFAKDSLFEVVMVRYGEVRLSLRDDSCTYRQYPYHFSLDVFYRLAGRRLDVTFQVQNQDEKDMYFGIGGHPGFNVPLERGLKFEDYLLEFPESCCPKLVCFSADHFVEGEPIPYVLKEGRYLPLTHELFDEDAIVLTNIPRQVTLKSQKGNKGVRLSFPDMNYLGLWHMPRTDAPYVCLEPWAALPSRKGVVEDLQTQPGLLQLASGEVYRNTWSIEILSSN